jgi:hypothetical protein
MAEGRASGWEKQKEEETKINKNEILKEFSSRKNHKNDKRRKMRKATENFLTFL